MEPNEFEIDEYLQQLILEYSNNIQKNEMAKHKWILSEQAGSDLKTYAVLDWVEKYAKTWRDHFNECLKTELQIIMEYLDDNNLAVNDENIKPFLIEWLENYERDHK